MSIDPTIPLKVQTPSYNPLQMAMQAASFRLANAQGNSLQQAMDANTATSEAVQKATDPTTGVLNPNKLSALISQDPRAAYNLQSIMKGVQDQRQAQITQESTGFDLNKKKIDWGMQSMGQIAANPNATQQDVVNMALEGVKLGMTDPEHARMVLSTMPGSDAPKGAIQQWARGLVARVAGAQNQQGLLTPNPTIVDTGGAKQYVDTNPSTNPSIVGTTLKNTLTPAEQTTQVNTYQNGQAGTISNRQNAINQGNADLLPGGTQGGAPSGNGRYPGAAPTNDGFNPTAAPIGAQGVADEAGKRYGVLQAAANTAKGQMKNYDLALEAVGGALPGKGGAKALNVPALLNTFGIQAGADTVKNNQLLLNYLNSASDQAASALGLSGSDARLAAAKAGQPDPEHMNAPALLESIQHVKGLQQAVLDRSNAATAHLTANGNNTGTLPQFEAAWNKAFDPDVSLLRSLPQDQRAAWLDNHVGNVGSATRNSFLKSYDAMAKLGAF